jgi:hypothetical protein
MITNGSINCFRNTSNIDNTRLKHDQHTVVMTTQILLHAQ